MGEQIRQTSSELRGRWQQRMPRFFRQLTVLCTVVIAVAFAINSGVPALGGTLHSWWQDIYTYIIGACIGIIATCKLTVAGGYKDLDPTKVIQGNVQFDRDAPQPNMSDIETQQPETTVPDGSPSGEPGEPHEFDPIESEAL